MPPKKRTKTARNTRRTVKTLTVSKGLERLPNMPLDVLLEIFALLHPRDLLSLARTSRAFRTFLMRRAAASFWEKARRQVDGLPDLPAHLSEPQYANLVFFEHCHECLQTRNVTAYWAACARYCNKCVKGFPHSADCAALGKIENEFEEVEDCEVVNLIYVPNSGDAKIHPQALEEIERAWSRLRTKANKEKFVNERMVFVAECEKFEDAMEEREAIIEAEKEVQRAALREKRMHAIMDRLRDEGWGTELDAMSEGSKRDLKNIKGVSETRELSNYGWKTLRTRVNEFLEGVKAERIKQERAAMIRARIGYLKIALDEHQYAKWAHDVKDRVYMRLGDCLRMSEIQTIIEDTPEEATEEDLMATFAHILPELTSRWVSERHAENIARLAKELGDSKAMKASDPLELAIAAFTCRRCPYCCPQSMRWTEMTAHHCFLRRPGCCDDTWKYYDRSNQFDLLFYDPDAAKSVTDCSGNMTGPREVIKACGGDPDTATYEELEACGVRLRCILCAMWSRQETYDWKAAIQHDIKEHRERTVVRNDQAVDPSITSHSHWERVSEENAATIRQLESAISDGTSEAKEHEVRYCCNWCGNHYYRTEPHVQEHVLKRHSKANAQLDVDYYLDLRIQRTTVMYVEAMANLDGTARQVVASGRGFFVPRERM